MDGQPIPAAGCVLVRIGSHRARSYMKAEIGRMPQGFYLASRCLRGPSAEFREVTQQEYEQIREIKGITRAVRVDMSDLRPYLEIY